MRRICSRLLSLSLLIPLFGGILGLTACSNSTSVSTFTVGGSVTGLGSGKSVVLTNNGRDPLTVGSDGAFTFATVMYSGQTYEIKVDTQPAGQTCTVTNGTGALLDQNITNVTVTCVTNTFTVGGSVSGLGSGKSVVLQNNNGDDLTVNYDPSNPTVDFTFATAVASGSTYSVTVLTPPAGQSCSVGNAQNTIADANVSDVTVVCRAWGTAALIESDNTGDAVTPQVAVDDAGNAIAVWSQDDGSRYNIRANRYAAGADWIEAIPIGTTKTGNAGSPQVAVDGNGNAVVVWSEDDGTPRTDIWANHFTLGVGWAFANLIETDNSGDAVNPQIAINKNDDAHAVWSQSDSSSPPINIWANHYTFGWGWSSAALIETDNAGDAQNPQIAVDPDGNAIAVWQQSDGTRDNIWANRYTVGSGWGTAVLIESDDTGDAQNPQVAVDANGNAVTVWQQSDGTRTNIMANRYTVGSGWETTATPIESDNGAAQNPQIAVDTDGNAVAVWQQADGTPRINICSNRYTVGSGWGTADLIESDNSADAVNPQVAVDNNGNAVAVWQSNGSPNNIWGNYNASNAGWGTAALIESNTGNATLPQVAIDPNGNAVAVWQQFDGTHTNIWANLFR